MKVTISATWLRFPWTMPIWDTAYAWLVKAGAGSEPAVKQIEAIKLAAQAGNPVVVKVKQHFDAVAKLVSAGLPKPSVFVAQHRRRSPLLPGGGQSSRWQGLAEQRKTMLEATKRTQEQAAARQAITQQAQQLARQRAAERARMAREAKARSAAAARVEARRQEREGYEAELEMLRKQLERRDLADEIRARLEAQAAHYEALIEKLQTPGTAGEATTTSEAMAAEQPEAVQDDAAEAYPSGASGDVEFNDGGT